MIESEAVSVLKYLSMVNTMTSKLCASAFAHEFISKMKLANQKLDTIMNIKMKLIFLLELPTGYSIDPNPVNQFRISIGVSACFKLFGDQLIFEYKNYLLTM